MKISRKKDNGFNVKEAFEEALKKQPVHWTQTPPTGSHESNSYGQDSSCWSQMMTCFQSPLKCNPGVQIDFRGTGIQLKKNQQCSQWIMEPKSSTIVFKHEDGVIPAFEFGEESECHHIDPNTHYLVIQVLDNEIERDSQDRVIAECLLTFCGFDASKGINYAQIPIYDSVKGDESGTIALNATFIENKEAHDDEVFVGNQLEIHVQRIIDLKDPTAELVKDESTFKQDMVIIISWFMYMILSIIFYIFGEDFTFIDALYLRIVTAFTVGYGDMYPVTNAGKLLNCLFIIIDTATIGFLTSKVMNYILKFREIQKEKKDALKRKRAQEAKEKHQEKLEKMRIESKRNILQLQKSIEEKDNDEDEENAEEYKEDTKIAQDGKENEQLKETGDETKEEREKETEKDKEAPQQTKSSNFWKDYKLYILGAIIVVFIVIGTVFMVYVEEYDTASAFEWNFVTLSTVGYGDVTPKSTSGKVFTIFYIMFGVSLVVYFGTAIFEKLDESRQRKFKEQVMRRALISEAQLLEFDVDGDGKIDKYEFLSKMLVETQEVEQSKIDEIMIKFKMLDADGSGTITTDELRHIENGRK